MNLTTLEVEAAKHPYWLLRAWVVMAAVSLAVNLIIIPFAHLFCFLFTIPALIIWYLYAFFEFRKIKYMPLSLELHSDRLAFNYCCRFAVGPREIPWNEVTELQLYGNLRDSRGQDLNLSYLDQGQYQALYNHYLRAKGLQHHASATGFGAPMPARQPVTAPPSGSIEVEGEPSKEDLKMLILILIPLLLVTPLMAYTIYLGHIDAMTILIIVVLAGVTPYLFRNLIHDHRHTNIPRKLVVNPAGIHLYEEAELQFSYAWNKITNLHIGAVRSAYRIEVESADDWNNLDHHDLPTSRFKEVFEIIREYVQYYGIPLEGTREWQDRWFG